MLPLIHIFSNVTYSFHHNFFLQHGHFLFKFILCTGEQIVIILLQLLQTLKHKKTSSLTSH